MFAADVQWPWCLPSPADENPLITGTIICSKRWLPGTCAAPSSNIPVSGLGDARLQHPECKSQSEFTVIRHRCWWEVVSNASLAYVTRSECFCIAKANVMIVFTVISAYTHWIDLYLSLGMCRGFLNGQQNIITPIRLWPRPK